MKQGILLIISTVQFLCGNAQPVKNHGQLKVTGTQLTGQHNEPVVLNGMSFGWSCFHPRFYTAGVVNTLATDWNCNVIRAAMGVEPDGGYLKDSAGNTKLVTTVVDAAIKEGIYVIIDWHCHNIKLTEARAFFKAMATKYHQYPNIIYELFNEPDYETWPEIKAYAIDLISTIRAIDANNIILVGSPRWDQDVDLPAASPITGFTNLMYTMHFYAGTHKQWLRDKTTAAIDKGLPIFISESAGMDATGDGKLADEEWKKYIGWMEEKKLSWITWSVSDKNESCSVLTTSAASNGKWQNKDLKESGLKTRAFLRKKNNK